MKKKRATPPKNYSREAASIIFIGLGIILILAIISYDRTDNPGLEIENNSIHIKNWLGPLGAAIADPLMNYTLGYPILILPILIIYAAFQTYKGKNYSTYLSRSLVMLVWALILSVLLAFPESFETQGQMREYFPSGLIGGFAASNLVIYLGKFGSALVMTIVTLAMAVITLRLEVGKIAEVFGVRIQEFVKQTRKFLTEMEKKRYERKKEKIRKDKLKKAQFNKPVEIKTTQSETIENLLPEPTIKKERPVTDPIPEIPREKPTIKTTLDEILQQVDGAQVDTTSIKNAALPFNSS